MALRAAELTYPYIQVAIYNLPGPATTLAVLKLSSSYLKRRQILALYLVLMSRSLIFLEGTPNGEQESSDSQLY